MMVTFKQLHKAGFKAEAKIVRDAVGVKEYDLSKLVNSYQVFFAISRHGDEMYPLRNFTGTIYWHHKRCADYVEALRFKYS